ncbi:YhcN/YlaJ family sporulation lipoprotein [Bacillus sp. 1P06AnD]|uniref:YhcN/YlaJ family sporulation lipoprotein n=1 Tax=Bacillus sp. 1P06AnD TaxID=3132208 RepID=UPI0039A30B89
MPKFRMAFLVLLLIAGGCQMNNKDAGDNNRTNDSTEQNQGNVNTMDNDDSQKASTALKEAVRKVPEVQNVETIVLGPYSFIAVDVDQNLDKEKVAQVKQQVADAVKNEKDGQNALIVADPDILASLKKVGNDIAAGKPVTGILEELSDIAQRIVPETSAETNTEHTAPRK